MKIGVLGIGKLGLCFSLNLEKAGFAVTGVDIDEAYVGLLAKKQFESPEPFVTEYLKAAKNFTPSTCIADVIHDEFEYIFIMVATPAGPDGSYSHYQIERIAEELKKHGKRNKKTHLVVGCTTMPGYCDTLAQQLAPYNYAVSYSPEFIAQGSIIKNQQYPDQILIGEADAEAGDAIAGVLKKIALNQPTVCRMNRLSAEICKLATNCFLTTKISFANSIGDLAKKAGAEQDKILAAIGVDSRIGPKYLQHGFGFGGPCFPRDNRAFNAFAHSMQFDLLLGKATDMVNEQHLEFQFEEYVNKYSPDEKIIFNEITYKPGTVIIEESQPLRLALKLANAGRTVLIKEKPEVIEQLKKLYPGMFAYETIG